jgi:hypothetical protein
LWKGLCGFGRWGHSASLTRRYGLSILTDEKTALTLHKLMHLPLGVLVLVVPPNYLALLRWGWIKQRQTS